jgi:hypothetical protein
MDSRLWSVREKAHLETDLMHWDPGAMYSWLVVAQAPLAGAEVSALSLPDDYAAWAVSRTRGLRFRLREGESIPMFPGMADSLEVRVGPATELEARLASIPLTVPAFQCQVLEAPGGFALHLGLPQAAHIRWTLWTLDGRSRGTGRMDLPQGLYRFAPGTSDPAGGSWPSARSGMYLLSLEWTLINPGIGSSPENPMANQGRLTRKIAIP